jgi:hypothetical protein
MDLGSCAHRIDYDVALGIRRSERKILSTDALLEGLVTLVRGFRGDRSLVWSSPTAPAAVSMLASRAAIRAASRAYRSGWKCPSP